MHNRYPDNPMNPLNDLVASVEKTINGLADHPELPIHPDRELGNFYQAGDPRNPECSVLEFTNPDGDTLLFYSPVVDLNDLDSRVTGQIAEDAFLIHCIARAEDGQHFALQRANGLWEVSPKLDGTAWEPLTSVPDELLQTLTIDTNFGSY